MKKFWILVAFTLLLTPVLALSEGRCDRCEAWRTGHGSPPGQPTTCLVTIEAPTYGGQVGLDVRDASGKSRWPAPRIKTVGPGFVRYRIGCNWLKEPTDQVYLCVDGKKGGNGNRYTSIRWRKTGDLDRALKRRRLEMCLRGKECPRYAGELPPTRSWKR